VLRFGIETALTLPSEIANALIQNGAGVPVVLSGSNAAQLTQVEHRKADRRRSTARMRPA
jgi:hypothetical protein